MRKKQNQFANLNSQAKNKYLPWNSVKSSTVAPQVAPHPIRKGDNIWARVDKEQAEVFRPFLHAVFTPGTDHAETKKEMQDYLDV